jgi:hypothetical protein
MQETSGDAGSGMALFLSLGRSRDSETMEKTEARLLFFFFCFAVVL